MIDSIDTDEEGAGGEESSMRNLWIWTMFEEREGSKLSPAYQSTLQFRFIVDCSR